MRIVLPSGLNASGVHPVRMHQGLADGPAGGGVPEPRRLVAMLAVRIVLPSGLNATDHTRSGCAMGWPSGRPVAASHSRAVLSEPPVRIVLPSGLNARARISGPLLHGLAETMARRDVPEPDFTVMPAARRVLPSGPNATIDIWLSYSSSRPTGWPASRPRVAPSHPDCR